MTWHEPNAEQTWASYHLIRCIRQREQKLRLLHRLHRWLAALVGGQ